METTNILSDDAIAEKALNRLRLNLQVAAIAGWTDIEEWHPNPKEEKAAKVYQGTNLSHPEWGKFVPKYVESIDAITKVFDLLGFEWSVTSDCYAFVTSQNELIAESNGETPAIALCNLLLEINPTPIKPVQKAEVLEAVF